MAVLRLQFSVALLAGLLAGCSTTKTGDTHSPPEGKQARTEEGAAPAEIKPLTGVSGRVVLVNEPLRYVVVDFGVSQLPPPLQRLGVFRDGKKVGEVRLSSQARGGNVAADVMAGEARVGDEVRSP
jgi:hypothetical protein